MASLIKVHHLSKVCLKNPGVLYTAVRNHWNKDYKPGPFPKTMEERAAAAEKYGLLLEEYEPYPDDGAGHGDYPKLPLIAGDQKDPWYPYDYPELKRNFNEPMHLHCEMIGEDRYDVNIRLRWPMWQQVLTFFSVMGGLFILYAGLDKMKMYRPVLPKQYPAEGKKHYSYDKKK